MEERGLVGVIGFDKQCKPTRLVVLTHDRRLSMEKREKSREHFGLYRAFGGTMEKFNEAHSPTSI